MKHSNHSVLAGVLMTLVVVMQVPGTLSAAWDTVKPESAIAAGTCTIEQVRAYINDGIIVMNVGSGLNGWVISNASDCSFPLTVASFKTIGNFWTQQQFDLRFFTVPASSGPTPYIVSTPTDCGWQYDMWYGNMATFDPSLWSTIGLGGDIAGMPCIQYTDYNLGTVEQGFHPNPSIVCPNGNPYPYYYRIPVDQGLSFRPILGSTVGKVYARTGIRISVDQNTVLQHWGRGVDITATDDQTNITVLQTGKTIYLRYANAQCNLVESKGPQNFTGVLQGITGRTNVDVIYDQQDICGGSVGYYGFDIAVYDCSHRPQCSDSIDNDGDGLSDAADPGCYTNGTYSPLDNDESNSTASSSSSTPASSSSSSVPSSSSSSSSVPSSSSSSSTPSSSSSSIRSSSSSSVISSSSSSSVLSSSSSTPASSSSSAPASSSSVSSGDSSSSSVTPQCRDGIDNDGDGVTDHPNDFSCSTPDDNDETFPKAQCQDGVDNDGDGKIDIQDPGCHTDGNPNNNSSYVPTDNDESNPGTVQCNDGVDNADPEDTLIDQFDPGCHTDGNPNNAGSYNPLDNDETNQVSSSSSSSSSSPLPQCRDGIDNDGDGVADHPADFSCSNPDDNDETFPKAQCQDGADNDGDGLIDFPNDPGCFSRQDNDETNTNPPVTFEQCRDGVDNDGDGRIDIADPGCHTDGNASNPNSFNPLDNTELDGQQVAVIPGTFNPFTLYSNIVNNNNVNANSNANANANANPVVNVQTNPSYGASFAANLGGTSGGGSVKGYGGSHSGYKDYPVQYVSLLPQTGLESFAGALSATQGLLSPVAQTSAAATAATIASMLMAGLGAGVRLGRRFL